MPTPLRLITRNSPMALTQANQVKQLLQATYPDRVISIIGITTAGDRFNPKIDARFEGKDLFIKELQKSLLANEADIAVHCVKDLSVHSHPDLCLPAILPRDDPRDALIGHRGATLATLPAGTIVGTASPRRHALIADLRPDLIIKPIRGNVNTRLQKLNSGQYDAIVLAVAGLDRLNFTHLISEYLPTDTFVPAIGQGGLALETRQNDTQTQALLSPLNDHKSALCIQAERRVNQVLNGSCNTPIGAYATLSNDQLTLQAVVGSLDNQPLLQAKSSGPATHPDTLGDRVADQLIQQGARHRLQE